VCYTGADDIADNFGME